MSVIDASDAPDISPSRATAPTGENPAARLMELAEREGPVVALPGGVTGVFDPELSLEVDKANAEGLMVAESLVDVLGLRKTEQPASWREVRAIVAEQSARLATPEHLKALHGRMRTFLARGGGRETDLTRLVWECMSRTLIPCVIDDLDTDGYATLDAEQQLRYRVQQTQRISFRQRISDFMLLRASTRVITRHLKRRLRDGSSHEDYAQALLALADRIGVDRVTYLVTVQLIAISGVPGMMAACLLFALHRYPEWHPRIAAEVEALEEDALYTLPMRRLPCTMRFIKEAMRMWTTPFVTRRVASREIVVGDLRVPEGQTYELSSYILHHSPRWWDDPETFDPDRWLPERQQVVNGTYVPFGFAPRACAGASLGHAQLVLYLATIVRDFDATIAPHAQPWMRMDDGFAVPAGMFGTLVPRDW